MKAINKMINAIAIFLMIFAILPVQGAAAAQVAPGLNLPTGPVTVTYTWGNPTFPLNVVLSNVGPGYDVQDNVAYLGWCVDRATDANPLQNLSYSVSLYSTYDPNLPSNLASYGQRVIPWDRINWVLNNKGTYSNQTISDAIWWLIIGRTTGSDLNVVALVNAAIANGTGFIPVPGQIVAVIVTNGSGIGPTDDWQENIIEVPMPEPPAPSSICGYVYEDANDDGVFDSGEMAIPGVTVTLTGSDDQGNPVNLTVQTGADGKYCFTDLQPGTYTITETQPANYLDGKDTQGTPGTGTTGNDVFSDITLPAGFNGENNNFGELTSRLSLGDLVWYDQNQNGIQDANEPGYGGMTVELYSGVTCSGGAMATTTTNASGLYQFTNLLAGTYSVGFSGLPAGWSISPKDQGSDNALDSDANAAGCIENINLVANNPDEDMGLHVTGSLGDNVMCVSTGQPLANITVSLFKDFDGNGVADGPAIATTTTNASGFYQFTGLEVALAGGSNVTKYIVQVDTADADLGTCNVPVPPTSYNPPLDSNNPNDPDNDFRFQQAQQTGQIAPTATTCTDFANGNAADLTELAYTIKNSKINNVAPGVLFYYSKITAPASSFSIQVVQSNTNAFPALDVQQEGGNAQAILYDSGCVKSSKLGSLTIAKNGTTHTVTFNVTGATVGQVFYIGIKYSPKPLNGFIVTSPYPTVQYSFVSNLNNVAIPTSQDSFNLIPK